MKKFLFVLLLLCRGAVFAQASDDLEYDITFTLADIDITTADLYFISQRGSVHFDVCTYTLEPIDATTTKIRLQGRYGHIVGKPGFLATICIAEKYTTKGGIEKLQNYFIRLINFGSERTDTGHWLITRLGTVKLNEVNPFIYAVKTNNAINIEQYSTTLGKYDYGIDYEITNWSKMQLKK